MLEGGGGRGRGQHLLHSRFQKVVSWTLAISRMAPSASAVSRLPFRAQYRSKPPVLPVKEPPRPASPIQQNVMRPLVDGAQLAQLALQPSALSHAGGGWWKSCPRHRNWMAAKTSQFLYTYPFGSGWLPSSRSLMPKRGLDVSVCPEQRSEQFKANANLASPRSLKPIKFAKKARQTRQF